MSNDLKKLTCKNPKDYEAVAYDVINQPNTNLFKELVESDDYLFDFIKQNVANRLSKHCNGKNYLNLLKFLKYYSPSYEEFIVSNLVRYADEDLTDSMLDLFENGENSEKTYCAKFFEYVQDPLALELLKKYAYSDDTYLSSNCAMTLKAMNDSSLYDDSINKLKSEDEFEKLNAVKFLCAYGDLNAIPLLLDTLKTSSMAENIAYEIPYLMNLFDVFEYNFEDGLYLLDTIVGALGEIIPLAVVFDFQLYEVFEKLLNSNLTPNTALVLLNAKNQFDTLTENNEYLFDESKDVKEEVSNLKGLLSKVNEAQCVNLVQELLDENSIFVNTALKYSKDFDKIRALLSSNNQTLVLEVIEILKMNNNLTMQDKELALKNVSDNNIRNIIEAI